MLLVAHVTKLGRLHRIDQPFARGLHQCRARRAPQTCSTSSSSRSSSVMRPSPSHPAALPLSTSRDVAARRPRPRPRHPRGRLSQPCAASRGAVDGDDGVERGEHVSEYRGERLLPPTRASAGRGGRRRFPATEAIDRHAALPADAERSIEPAAGKHADQCREQSPHDDAGAGTESSYGHCSVSQMLTCFVEPLPASAGPGCSPGVSPAAPLAARTNPPAVRAVLRRRLLVRQMLSEERQRARPRVFRRAEIGVQVFLSLQKDGRAPS